MTSLARHSVSVRAVAPSLRKCCNPSKVAFNCSALLSSIVVAADSQDEDFEFRLPSPSRPLTSQQVQEQRSGRYVDEGVPIGQGGVRSSFVNLLHSDPVITKSLDFPFRDTNVRDGEVIAWPEASPIAMHVVNQQDAMHTIQVHVTASPDRSMPMKRAMFELDIGPSEHHHRTFSPLARDPWGPWLWPRVLPQSAPTVGNLLISFARPGGV